MIEDRKATGHIKICEPVSGTEVLVKDSSFLVNVLKKEVISGTLAFGHDVYTPRGIYLGYVSHDDFESLMDKP